MIQIDQTLREAVRHYGEDKQILMLFEEMAELQNAICKYTRDRDCRQHVCEEIADAMIMLDQMSIIFGENKVNAFYDEKVDRLKKRMEEEKP